MNTCEKRNYSRSVVIIGPNNLYTLGLVRCLGEGFKRTKNSVKLYCIVFGGRRGFVAASRWPYEVIHADSPGDCAQVALDNRDRIGKGTIIFGANDFAAAAIDERLNEFLESYYCATAGCQGALVKLMDKRKMFEHACRFGMRIPQMVMWEKGKELPRAFKYPVFTKSCRTIDGGKCDEFVCNNFAELKVAASKMHAERCFLSEFIEKSFELNYFGIVLGGKVSLLLKNRVDRFSPGHYGGYQRFSAVDSKDYLAERIERMMADTGYTDGMFSVEFLVDKKNDVYYMETNYRHDGATYRALPGINMPLQLCKYFWGEKVDLSIAKNDFWGINEIEDFVQVVFRNHGSLVGWTRDFLRADSRMLVNFRDVKPFVFSILAQIVMVVRRAVKYLNSYAKRISKEAMQ